MLHIGSKAGNVTKDTYERMVAAGTLSRAGPDGYKSDIFYTSSGNLRRYVIPWPEGGEHYHFRDVWIKCIPSNRRTLLRGIADCYPAKDWQYADAILRWGGKRERDSRNVYPYTFMQRSGDNISLWWKPFVGHGEIEILRWVKDGNYIVFAPSDTPRNLRILPPISLANRLAQFSNMMLVCHRNEWGLYRGQQRWWEYALSRKRERRGAEEIAAIRRYSLPCGVTPECNTLFYPHDDDPFEREKQKRYGKKPTTRGYLFPWPLEDEIFTNSWED